MKENLLLLKDLFTFWKVRFISTWQLYHKCLFVILDDKPVDVKSDSYAEYNVYSNEKNPEFKIGDHARTSKYKNIFAKGYTSNWSEVVFVISKVKKKTVP